MNASLRAVLGAAQAEWIQLVRSPLMVLLTIVQGVTFVLLVSLFGLTGSRAPTALIDHDHGPYAQQFIKNLQQAHHSFALRFMDEATSMAAVHHGNLVAVITIPPGFSSAIARGRTMPVNVVVDNIDTDMTDDIQRALPSAIVAFGRDAHLPGIHVQTREHDLIDHDTDFIPYLVLSALILDALIIAGTLSAVAVAREYESGTAALVALSPVHPIMPLFGRVLATNAVSVLAMLVTTSVVVFGYGVVPKHPLAMAAVLLVCIVIFGAVGAALGSVIRRTLPVASLIFGISLPLYLNSGSYEPARFDGQLIWISAHFSPVYYAVGIIENAAHGFSVTPESILVNYLALAGWAFVAVAIAWFFVRRNVTT